MQGEVRERLRTALGEAVQQEYNLNSGDHNRSFGLVTGRMLVDIYADIFPANASLPRCPPRQKVDAGKFPKLVWWNGCDAAGMRYSLPPLD